MSGRLEKRITVFCPTHEGYWAAERPATRIYCPMGHGHELPGVPGADSPWEYCTECDAFWPVDLTTPGFLVGSCRRCKSTAGVRFLCSNCATITMESEAASDSRRIRFEPGSGLIPYCPGCGLTVTHSRLFPHECETALAVMITSRIVCPFCHESTVGNIEFEPENCPRCNQMLPAGSNVCGHCGRTSPQLARPEEELGASEASTVHVAASTVLKSTVHNGADGSPLKERSDLRLSVTLLAATAVVLIVGGLFLVANLMTPAEAPKVPSTPPAGVATNQAPIAPQGMVLVPAGDYVIGSDRDVYEQPQHAATLRAFYIDQYEVSRAQYRPFLEATGRATPAGWESAGVAGTNDMLPVTGVSWEDAQAFAAWAKKRLPTEQEWEAAARGPSGWVYPWGNEWIAGRANVAGATGGAVTPVGSYPEGASPVGALDMAGNAAEWTASDAVLYPGSSAERIPEPDRKVFRGGSYRRPKGRATATWRNWAPGNGSRSKYVDFGFRCALDAP